MHLWSFEKRAATEKQHSKMFAATTSLSRFLADRHRLVATVENYAKHFLSWRSTVSPTSSMPLINLSRRLHAFLVVDLNLMRRSARRFQSAQTKYEKNPEKYYRYAPLLIYLLLFWRLAAVYAVSFFIHFTQIRYAWTDAFNRSIHNRI